MNASTIDIRRAVVADARAIANVHVASWRTTYTGIVAQRYLDGLSADEFTTAWERWLSGATASGSEIFVATAGGVIAGFVAGGPRPELTNGYDAQLYSIYLRSEAQGQGTGRKLIQAWAAAAVDRALTAAIVDVLARNPARAFYERLGARYLEDIEVTIGGDVYIEARYGWTDLRVLAA